MTSLPVEKAKEVFTAVAENVLSNWGVAPDRASLRLIKYRENAVFEVIPDDGNRTALRLHRPGYHSDSELRSELQWMTALSEAGIAVPEIIPTLSGELFIQQGHPELESAVQVDMFEWIDGKQLGTSEEGLSDIASVEKTYETLGALAAKVHNQASSWNVPNDFCRHSWDAEGLAGESPFWGRFWEISAADPNQKELLNAVRAPLLKDLLSLPKDSSTYSMIHADFAPENILIDNGQLRLIDFDDAGFGWHLFELATSLFFIIEEPYFEQAKQALILGYRSERELSESTLKDFDLLMLGRALTYVGWVHTRSDTETAMELTPWLLNTSCKLIERYLG